MLPSGRLREARKGVKRADAVIVTKSSALMDTPGFDVPLFQTRVKYGTPGFFNGKKMGEKVLVVSGIANNADFVSYANSEFKVTDVLEYPDHYSYKQKDIEKITSRLDSSTTLVTTEKDYVKLKLFDDLKQKSCAFVPIKIEFMNEEERFLQMVDKSLKDYKLNQ